MSTKTKSLSDQAYEAIKSNILNLTYAPGMHLTEAMLTQELNMSRSPIRTALKQLQTDGLIVTDHYKSLYVKEITDQDIHEIYQLRELIETAAFRYIFDTNMQTDFSYRLEEKVVRMCAAANDPYEWELADTEMHMTIVGALNNSRITKVYENTLDELIRIGQVSVKFGMHIEETNSNLKKLVSYMRENDFENAFAILKNDHFTIGKESALKREE